MNGKYQEIIELHQYCLKIGVGAILKNHLDGYVLIFPNGGDFIQHCGSYGNYCGCVEPAIGSRLDYTSVPLKNAKALVKRHKDRLNTRVGDRYDRSR